MTNSCSSRWVACAVYGHKRIGLWPGTGKLAGRRGAAHPCYMIWSTICSLMDMWQEDQYNMWQRGNESGIRKNRKHSLEATTNKRTSKKNTRARVKTQLAARLLHYLPTDAPFTGRITSIPPSSPPPLPQRVFFSVSPGDRPPGKAYLFIALRTPKTSRPHFAPPSTTNNLQHVGLNADSSRVGTWWGSNYLGPK